MNERTDSHAAEGRLIGLDIGERRIGVAVSDEMNVVALPERVIERRNLEDDLRALSDLAREKRARGFIVGLPIRLDGSQGKEAQRVAEFARKLAQRADIPVEMSDERFSTKQAERHLIKSDVKRKRRRQVIDKIAAQIILQSYLDAQGERCAEKVE
jgi:putative Holliday junction resolvase